MNLINYYVLKNKKIQKNSEKFQKTFQKICDFLKYFHTKFA